MPLAAGQKIYVTDPSGAHRRRLPVAQVTGAECLISRYGGMSSFTLGTAVPFRGDALPTILKGDRVEMYYRGVLRFRGWIEERTRTEGEPDTLAFVGYGLSFLAGQQLCFGRYAYAGDGVDVGDAFAEAVRDATASRNQTLPGALGRAGMPLYGALQVAKVGTATTFVDGYNRLLRDVINDLVQNQAGNLAHWGGDVDAYGRDRLYLRPLAATAFPPTHTVVMPSRATVGGQAEDQSGDLKNRVLVTGGQPRFPQLLHNGGFDLPSVFQTGDSGLITDGDFESRTWSLGGGASYKDAGHQEGQPFSGNWMVEMDHVGETADKSGTFATTPTAGHNYVFSARAKKEVGLQTADGSGSLTIKNGAGTTLLTVPLVVDPAGTAWDYFSATFPMPAAAAQWSAHFQNDHISAYAGDQGGLLIDAVSLEDASVLYQDGWQVEAFGGASFAAVNWAYKDVAFDGLYCVYLSPRAADANGQDCQMIPLGSARVPVTFKQTLRISYRYRSPLGAAQGNPGHLGLPKMQLQLEWHRGDNGYIRTDSVTVNASAASAVWQYVELVASAPSDAASVLPILNPRGSGDILIDCVSVQDAEAVAAGDVPVAADGRPGYQPEGSLILFRTASGSGLGGDCAASEATYGSRVDVYGVGSVDTLGGLARVADARLRTAALPLTRPSVTRIEDPAVYWPGDSISLQGEHGRALSGGQILTVVEVRLQFGDLFACTLGMDRESPDATLEVKRLIQDQLQANGPGGAAGAGGSGAGYNSPTNFGGGGTGGDPVYRTTLAAGPADPTLHDAFTGAPHASQASQDGWTGTTAEVVAARTRTSKGVSSTTLEGRLDAMEADIASGSGFTPAAALAPTSVGFDHADYAGQAEYVTWRASLSTAPAGGAVAFLGWQTSADGSAWSAESFGDFEFQGPGVTSGGQYARARSYPLASGGATPTPSGWVASQVVAYSAPPAGGGGSYTLTPATATALGGVKVGGGLSVAADGTLSAAGGGSGTGAAELNVRNGSGNGFVQQAQGGYPVFTLLLPGQGGTYNLPLAQPMSNFQGLIQAVANATGAAVTVNVSAGSGNLMAGSGSGSSYSVANGALVYFITDYVSKWYVFDPYVGNGTIVAR